MTPLSFISTLCLIGGLSSVVLGVWLTRERLARIRRVLRRQRAFLSTMPEGWGSWFLQGFADMTVGVYVARTLAALLFWTLIGLGLAGVGLTHVV